MYNIFYLHTINLYFNVYVNHCQRNSVLHFHTIIASKHAHILNMLQYSTVYYFKHQTDKKTMQINEILYKRGV